MDIAPDPSSSLLVTARGEESIWESLDPGVSPADPIPDLLEERAGLTLSALSSDAARWVGVYRHATNATDEPADFLEFVIAHATDRVVACMARFERALELARSAQPVRPGSASTPRGKRIRLHPAASVIDLPGPAADVIGAVALGLSPPAYAGWPVLVAPGLPTLWRQATTFEDALCTWLTRPRATPEVRERFIGAEPVIERLRAIHAIVDA